MENSLTGPAIIVVAMLAVVSLLLAIFPARSLLLLSRNRKLANDVVIVRAYRGVALIALAGLIVLLVKGL